MINLKIDPEFQNQIPPLTDDEYKQLEENILKEGKLISPLIVWGNTLVDGHNRYEIVQEHPEISFSTMPLPFESREEVLAWICKNQLGRRNLTPEQKKFLIGNSTVWNIGSPVETATTSTRLLPRKPPRRNRASASRLQSGTGSSYKQRKTGSSHWGTSCCTYRYRLWLLAGCVRRGAPYFCFIVVGCTSNRITATPYRFLPAPARTTR